MQAMHTLAHEHHLLKHLLQCLEHVAQATEERGQLLSPHATELLSLMQSFADGSHQRKEEEVLFSRLLRRAALSQRLYIGRLFADHARERHDLRGLHANLMGAAYGDPLCVREFVVRTRRYVDSHRSHMAREDEVLFPLVDQLLDPSDDAKLATGFAAVDRGLPPGLDLEAMVRDLCAKIGVRYAEAGAPAETVVE